MNHIDMSRRRWLKSGWVVFAAWFLWPVAVLVALYGVLLAWAAVDSDSLDRHILRPIEGVPLGIPLTMWLLLLVMIAFLPPFFWSVAWCDRRAQG